MKANIRAGRKKTTFLCFPSLSLPFPPCMLCSPFFDPQIPRTLPPPSLSLLLFSGSGDAKKLIHEQSKMPAQKQAAVSSSSPSAGSDNSSPFASAAADPPDENPNAVAGDEVNSPSHSSPPQDQDGATPAPPSYSLLFNLLSLVSISFLEAVLRE